MTPVLKLTKVDSSVSGSSDEEAPSLSSFSDDEAGASVSSDEVSSSSSSTVTKKFPYQREYEILSAATIRCEARRQEMKDNSEEVSAEVRRDWQCGIITGHRLWALFLHGGFAVGIWWLQSFIWPTIGSAAEEKRDRFLALFTLIWLMTFIPAVLGFVGMLLYKHDLELDERPSTINLVVFRIVSRGTNEEALAATVARCRAEMKACPRFPYVIEVLTDVATPDDLFGEEDDLVKIVVPDKYQTTHGSMYKARALQYAVEYSQVPEDAWLVHLDEETQLTSSGIKGIAAMISEEEASGLLRIGQGAIVYHRKWAEYPFLTLADMIRTGDDYGRFYLQSLFGITIFGLHGSYIVCRNDVEKSVGFDFGPRGSITEDAFWALKCMENGVRCRWVNGYLEEQSTQSVCDFMKQRRRWYLGLVLVSLYAPVKFRFRAGLALSTILWTFAPFGMIYTFLHVIFGQSFVHPVVRSMANYSVAHYFTLYLMGLKNNILEHGMTNPFTIVLNYIFQIVLLPLFAILESASTFYAMICPEMGFHVVNKD